MSGKTARRRFLAPEAIQTSAMDCGPAALKCLLEGHGIAASYGRLREACQTGVDGTSVEALETAARQLGLDAEQVLLPLDHVCLADAAALPAIVVTRLPSGDTHFVVAWRLWGDWVQVMDPAAGRRWVPIREFNESLFRYALPVAADDWRDWASSPDFLIALRARLATLGGRQVRRERLIRSALEGVDAYSLACLDASVRMVQSLRRAKAVRSGAAAVGLVEALSLASAKEPPGEPRSVPLPYWSAFPVPDDDEDPPSVQVRGAVLIRVRGVIAPQQSAELPAAPVAELQAALREPGVQPKREIARLLSFGGLVTPMALLMAMALAVGGVLVESLLFRGLFDISRDLQLSGQRLGALAGLLIFMTLLLLLELPITRESLRLGRRLEMRLRQTLLVRLPRLSDRYFHSRPVSDMAERAHGVYLVRLIPDLIIRCINTLWDLLFTLVAIALIAPSSLAAALALTATAIVLPLAVQPLLNERDLRVKSHAGALFGFYLDALLGLVAIRAHGAEQAIRREHDSRLAEWSRSSQGMIGLALLAQAVPAVICFAIAAHLLYDYLLREGVTGTTLLLVFWTLKLPASGKQLSSLMRQYPSERNALLRLLEPLTAPLDDAEAAAEATAAPPESSEARRPTAQPSRRAAGAGLSIRIRSGQVVAAGHTLLRDIQLELASGEHIAIVGPSGAGKSSLLGVLLGWHRLTEGTIEIDGVPLDGAGLGRLRRACAWVDPAVQLWNRPFLENLCFSVPPDSAPLDIGQVLDAAALRGVVQKLPLGLQTPLGEAGGLVSGGEGQRVRLGRAFLQEPVRLVLLDEPFRGLDHRQRRLLLQQARAWWESRTLLCVTHDVQETLAFDRVLVIEQGRIVEDGAPRRLAGQASRYRALLDAEESLRGDLWQAALWRRVRVDGGRISEPSGAKTDETRRTQRAGLARG